MGHYYSEYIASQLNTQYNIVLVRSIYTSQSLAFYNGFSFSLLFTIPPPCTHTPSSAALLSPVTSHVMDSIFPEVSKGNNTHAKLSGTWPAICPESGFFTTIAQSLWRLLSSLSHVNTAPTIKVVWFGKECHGLVMPWLGREWHGLVRNAMV